MNFETLSVFSPLPPEQNGIADYTYHLLKPLSSIYNCVAYVTDPHAVAPPGVNVSDSMLAFFHLREGGRILHQIGNNSGHVFVLNALRKWGGVTTLHDQNLHYLYEMAGASQEELFRNMAKIAPKIGSVYSRHWREQGLKTPANYVLFDMLDEVLMSSSAVIVHSKFAKQRITALYGSTRSAHVVVIPHLAFPFTTSAQKNVRAELNISSTCPLILTSGFATLSKRFDWLIAALDEIGRRGIEFFWVHAGKERPEEFALSKLLDRFPIVKERTKITGYLSECDLNTYINACDMLVNLRFPSVGESSGTLVRAMSAGKCCVVSDTAAYSDISRTCVIHVPIFQAIKNLIETLEPLLKNQSTRLEFGGAAKHIVETEWAPDIVALAYRDVMEISVKTKRSLESIYGKSSPEYSIRITLSNETTKDLVSKELEKKIGIVEIAFEMLSIIDVAELILRLPRLFEQLLPETFLTTSMRLEKGRSPFDIVIRIKGSNY